MKKCLSLILSLVVFVNVFSGMQLSVFAETSANEEVDDSQLWEYTIHGEGVELTKYLGTATDVYVPNKIEAEGTDYKVLKLGDSIFADNDSLNSVTLGEGILEIGEKAFYDADNLVCILTSEEMTTIGGEAFYSCNNFNSIILYDAITTIGEDAFAECPNLTVWCNEGTVGYEYVVANAIPYEILNPNAEPEIYEYNTISYYIMNGEAIAVDFDETVTEVAIPAVVNGYPVTELRGTFQDCVELISVDIAEGVLQIGDDTFYGCKALQKVSIPKSVSSIGEYAFYHCESLQEVIIPDGITTIAFFTFGYCISLKNVIIPDSVIVIENYAFYRCESLQEIFLPDSVTTIAPTAFASCYDLEFINIPDSVTGIGAQAFAHCFSLQNITIPSSVTEIGMGAFSYCTNLQNVTLAEGLTTIGSQAFAESENLRSIGIPSSVMSIAVDAFENDVLLIVYEGSYAHDFAIENNLLYLAWDGVTYPETLVVDGVTYCIMGEEAVAIDCDDSVTEVRIPEKVNGYPVVELRGTFKECTNLVSVDIPESVTTIGENAFNGCSSLESIIIPDSVTDIGSYAFRHCRSMVSVQLPSNITSIEPYTFTNCYSLQEIDIPDNVRTIGASAFAHCSQMKEVVIPAGVTSIGTWAFVSCTGLQSITIPGSVKSMGEWVFNSCKNLQDVTIEEGITSLSLALFDGCDKLFTILIPKSVTTLSSLDSGKEHVWLVYEGSYAHNFAMENDLFYHVWDGVTFPEKVTSDGFTYYIIRGEAIAVGFNDSAAEVVVPEEVNGYPVTELHETFYNCENLVSVKIPNSVVKIGDYTFGVCSQLTSVSLPDNVRTIGSSVFYACKKLETIVLPEGITSIGGGMFRQCYSLRQIVIPETVTTIGSSAFEGCTSLETIEIPNGVTDINSRAFVSCESLQNIALPEQLSIINSQMFVGCTSLKTVVIPQNVTRIENNAFAGCPNLQTLLIPKSVTYVNPIPFTESTILLVYEDSYMYKFAKGYDLLYFVLPETNNPEINYGTSIAGTVTYTDGTVATGATVEIIYDDGTSKEVVTADETGAYEFTYVEVGRYTIKATDSEGNSFSTLVSVKRMNVFDVFLEGDTVLVLKKGYSVSGTVNEGNATITVTDEDGNIIDGVTADENGQFTVENLPNGTYIITAESDNGSVCREVTVFDASISGLVLEIQTTTATIWGYVEVEDRDKKHNRRNWVQVTIYNEEGVVVAQGKSDSEGKYLFGKLPLGNYSIVAETAEMRPDKKHGFDRNHTVKGYAYISVTEAGIYQADTIVLYEENDHLATISGKVTAQGQTQVSEVVLRDVFRNEVARCQTGNNGKYTFSNVRDGLYFITAVTESKGMNFTVVVVRDGKIYGETDIVIYKSDKVKTREDRFKSEVPDCNDRKSALQYRDRIAEEKRFYDGLSEKEKKQLSKEYVERLNRYAEWMANTEYTAGDGVTVEQGGLVISGDEIESEGEIKFTLNVEKCEKYEASTDGVNSREDFIQHSMEDAAGKREIKQYYEISMTKTVNGEEKAITSVYKDTDAMGKFRITLTIPEEYRGHKHYSLIHVHHGEVVTLTDLDDDPNTITVEVDRFSTFALTATDESLAVDGDDLQFTGATLTLQDNIAINYNVSQALIVDNGYQNPYVKFVLNGVETIVNEYRIIDGKYVFDFTDISPNQMKDVIYATLYATKDGQLCSSEVSEYSVATYCYNMLSKYVADEYAEFRTLLVDLLNYGAASQIYTDYHADVLVNAALTEVQAAWGTSEKPTLETVFDKEYTVIENPTVTWKGAGLNLQDSVTMRFRIVADSIANLSVKVTTDGGEQWTIGNAAFEKAEEGYYVYFNGLNAGQMSEAVYVTVYEGDKAVSNTVCYSIESYAYTKQNSTDEKLSNVLNAMMKYGNAAYAYIN